MSKATEPIYASGESWTIDKIRTVLQVESAIADNELHLDYFPIQLEIVSEEQMIDAYASDGIPVRYNHWSFGKRFLANAHMRHSHGMGLAHELVINSDPCILYCMEDNTMTLQTLVAAHAAFGHNSFYKENTYFQQWTHPKSILDYFIFAREYIEKCEQRYGMSQVEEVLDACHALQVYGIDRYRPPPTLTLEDEERRQRERADYLEKKLDALWRTVRRKDKSSEANYTRFPREPQENILYFIEKNAPELPVWKREIIRITRKIAQYFYPQNETLMMNEGWASFVHFYMMHRLFEMGFITSGSMQEALHSHAQVIKQPAFDEEINVLRGYDQVSGKPIIERVPVYEGINPYALGFAIFRDIKRMCENPTKEDSLWFPNLVGRDWIEEQHFAIKNFRSEGFVLQYLSPKVIRDFKFFSVYDKIDSSFVEISAIHDEKGYEKVRKTLAAHYDRNAQLPHLEVWEVNRHGDRTLTLLHHPVHRKPIEANDAIPTLKYLQKLWEFPVELKIENSPNDLKLLWRINSKGELVETK
jgi:stage V sporulation protein R